MEMKAQGSGSAVWMLVGMLVAVYCCSSLTSSATLTVGGSQGWAIGPNYATWAAGQTFKIGDVLFFSYAQGAHDVYVVNESDYTACTTSSPIATNSAGNTNVTLTSSGAHYYLCSFPGHCTAGMKLAVTVGGGATPAPSPVGTPPPTPATTAPAPATKSPTATPVPSPVKARTPAPASTPTPAPTPLSPSPASAPTPSSPEPPPASSPPSPGAPGSATTAPPPSAAPSITASSALAAILLGLSGALLAL